LCSLISCLIFTTFSSGNMLFFYVIIYCWSYLFSFIFMQNQCVCSLWFFVLVLGFFDQLIIIVLCSFDSKQFPEIKKNVVPKLFWMLDCGWLSLNHPCCGVRAGEDAAARRRRWRQIPSTPKDYSPKPQFLIHFLSRQWFPFIPKSGIISIQMKSGGRAARRWHLPTDDYANSYTVHRCNKKGTGGENGY